MKKFLFIAAAALTLAACAKNEVLEPVIDNNAISFQAVNYLSQTKTDLPAAVKFEDYTSFTTDAFFHPADGGASQVFMAAETVSMDATTGEWAPAARTYFWPKTGYINFFSQAGSPAATIADATASNPATATYGSSGSPVVISDTTMNPVLASAAYRFARANWDNDSYAFTYGTNNTNVKGVPTLFHHLLAKVKFIVKFDATAGTNLDSWTLTINSATLNYANSGYTVVSLADPGTNATLAWPWTTNEQVGWTVSGSNVDLAAPGLPKSQTQAGIDASTESINPGRALFGEISVLPQDLTAATGTAAKLSLNYTLSHSYSGGTPIVETVNLADAADLAGNPALGSIALTDFVSNDYDSWYMNHKYIYTIIIKPDHKITFSPAVIPWVDNNNTSYVYPED